MRWISGTDGPDFQICSKSVIPIALLLRVVEPSGSPRITAPSLTSKDKTRHFPLHPPNMRSQQGSITKQNPHLPTTVILFMWIDKSSQALNLHIFAWSLSLTFLFPQITLGPSPLFALFLSHFRATWMHSYVLLSLHIHLFYLLFDCYLRSGRFWL